MPMTNRALSTGNIVTLKRDMFLTSCLTHTIKTKGFASFIKIVQCTTGVFIRITITKLLLSNSDSGKTHFTILD